MFRRWTSLALKICPPEIGRMNGCPQNDATYLPNDRVNKDLVNLQGCKDLLHVPSPCQDLLSFSINTLVHGKSWRIIFVGDP